MIAAAFVATLWGLLSANFIWLPFSSRLARLSELDIERMTLVMEGMLAVQSGAQPLLLAERLRSMVPEHQLKGARKGRKAPAGTPLRSRWTRPRERPTSAAQETRAHHVDERWMASYMDMVTVLMCLFIVLYAMSTVDANKFEKLRNSLATGFGAVASETVDTASGTVVPPEFVDKNLEAFAAVRLRETRPRRQPSRKPRKRSTGCGTGSRK